MAVNKESDQNNANARARTPVNVHSILHTSMVLQVVKDGLVVWHVMKTREGWLEINR
jgi:hypothetical protein